MLHNQLKKKIEEIKKRKNSKTEQTQNSKISNSEKTTKEINSDLEEIKKLKNSRCWGANWLLFQETGEYVLISFNKSGELVSKLIIDRSDSSIFQKIESLIQRSRMDRLEGFLKKEFPSYVKDTENSKRNKDAFDQFMGKHNSTPFFKDSFENANNSGISSTPSYSSGSSLNYNLSNPNDVQRSRDDYNSLNSDQKKAFERDFLIQGLQQADPSISREDADKMIRDSGYDPFQR